MAAAARGGASSRRWTSGGKRGRTVKTVRALGSYGALGEEAAGYVEHLRVRHSSAAYVESHGKRLREFCGWCEERGVVAPGEVTRAVLEQYQRWLFHRRLPSGEPLRVVTQYGLLSAVVLLFRYLTRRHVVLFNPGADLELPKLEQRLPRQVLTAEEVERVLSLPDVGEPAGLRDRAMLETLYSTGMRRMEVVGLGIYDLDHGRRTVTIRLGKGRKDRIVPIGARALAWVDRYAREARPVLLHGPPTEVLFVSSYGEALSTGYLTHMVAEYIAGARLGKRGSCHLLRHTCATLMLENGADIRYVQVLLGHAQLRTTEIYTHVAITKLREVHERTHPASAIAERKPRGSTQARREEVEAEETATPAALWSRLDAEASEDDDESEREQEGGA
jgi:integrase/recombinase XerD